MHYFPTLATFAMASLIGFIPLGTVQDAEKAAKQADLKKAVQGNVDKGKAKEKAQVQADLRTLVQGNNEFAFDLYGRLREKETNIVFSPYSISTALAMTYAGADGEVAKQMAKALHFTLKPEQLHPAVGHLVADLQAGGNDRPFELTIANALWGQEKYPFLPKFLKITENYYGSGFRSADFIGGTEQARQTINLWVEEQTKQRIKTILPPGGIDQDTRLVLTNAIYFKAAWKTPFPKSSTKDELFEVSPSRKISVPMMNLRAEKGQMFKYFAGDGFQWLELPYKGDRFSMVLLLPEKKVEMNDLEKTLTCTQVQKGIANLSMQHVDITLPRFKVNLNLRLLEQLKQMGMPERPLTEIAKNRKLEIHNVFHKAYIDVDEMGTEAAAATAVVIRKISGFNAASFRADHPFLFLIRDMQTDSILFLGRLTDPS